MWHAELWSGQTSPVSSDPRYERPESMSCLITMSQKELHRLELIQQIRGRSLSLVQAAELLGLSRSQVHRLLQGL
ncbi:hypothetical protein ILFOPFJJ_06689 [Ensifer psoraleae]|nr:hypothetical protein [Sinorhizobium psoraleae]